MAAHTYWRINVSLNNLDPSFLEIAEIEMRATVGGADQCNGGTALASSEFSASFNGAKAFANDGITTWWATVNGVTAAWIRYQFASPVDIVQYTIQALGAPTSNAGRAPQNWTFEYSDNGSAWTVADTRSGEVSWGGSEIRVYLAGGPVNLTLTKYAGYAVEGGAANAVTATKSAAYAVEGGALNAVTATKYTGYMVQDTQAYLSQMALEVLRFPTAVNAQLSQLAIEVLRPNVALGSIGDQVQRYTINT